jgi:8-oxo-dGDP phosphatase
MELWKTMKSKYLLRDRWLTVRSDTCETPDGVTIDPYYVLEYPDWVHIVALDSDGRLLITRQYRHAVGKVCVEIPCGIIEPGEAAAHAALRELLEETGCTTDNFSHIGSFYANPATHTNTVHCFLARGVSLTDTPKQDVTENITFEFVPVSHVFELIKTGEFSQGLHIASLTLGLHRNKVG